MSEGSTIDGVFVKSFKIGASYEVAFSPDGCTVAALGRNVVLWETHRKRRVATAHPFSHPSSASFTPDGRSLIVKNTSGEIVVLDAKSLDVQESFAGTGFGEGPRVIAIDNEFFLHASWSGDLIVRRVNTGEVVFGETNPGCMISDLAVSRDRTLVAYVLSEKGDHGSRLLFRRRLPFDQHSAQAPIPINKLCNAHIALADDGQVAVVTDLLTVFDLDGVAAATRPTQVSGTSWSLAWRPVIDQLVTVGGGEAICMDSQLESVWHRPMQYPSAVAFDSTGDLLALGGWSEGRIGRLQD